jgi:hypothetical protein
MKNTVKIRLKSWKEIEPLLRKVYTESGDCLGGRISFQKDMLPLCGRTFTANMKQSDGRYVKPIESIYYFDKSWIVDVEKERRKKIKEIFRG